MLTNRSVLGYSFRKLHVKFQSSRALSTQTEPKSSVRKETEGKYSQTLLLPKTPFDLRANANKREPEIQKLWDELSVYEDLQEMNIGESFVLHDGPPYANGDLHMGHALNKILKDFINKYYMMKGRKVRFIPGWDCHGLPIELKVLQNMKSSERQLISSIELRKRAAEFSKLTIASQLKSFKRYGVWGDWNNPYMTLMPEYEAAQIHVFGEMLSKGYIYRGKKPVYWSPSSRTALAEAELEYPDNHISRSVYVGFEAVELSHGVKQLLDHMKSTNSVRIAIWTTTPWTIPANLAVAVNDNLTYALVSHPLLHNGSFFIVASDLIDNFSKIVLPKDTSTPLQLIKHGTLLGREIVGTTYKHPFYDRVSSVVVGGEYITSESGTGLVHTAPGHGTEDYITGMKYNLPLLSPVNDIGCFTSEAGPLFEGLDVLVKGTAAVIEALKDTNVLLGEVPYNHKYPYDWRTKKPVILRTTEQWFASIDDSFRSNALQAISAVEWIPSSGRNRITGMVEGRGDWCISRQRVWGVPIPAFYHKTTNAPLINADTIKFVEKVFLEHGSDAWWTMETKDLLPSQLLPEGEKIDDYRKGSDTMDVWFDSGTSWSGVLQARGVKCPADMYLEGSDQHRGWFQSSLLTSVAVNDTAPFKKVLTHGFVLDEHGHKMSKSLGNVIDPNIIINGNISDLKKDPPYGADTLRLWVSSVDYSSDVSIGRNAIAKTFDYYKKLRNTFRFLLGNLNGFHLDLPLSSNISEVATGYLVKWENLASIDKYMLGKLSSVFRSVDQSYKNYQFYQAFHTIVTFVNQDMSSFYCDISKDRLYILSQSDERRKACQTVLYHSLKQLCLMIAPLVPHLSEDVWQHAPFNLVNDSVKSKQSQSIFYNGWIESNESFDSHDVQKWEFIMKLRNDVNKCIELGRKQKCYGASQETQAFIYIPQVLTSESAKSLTVDQDTIKKVKSMTNSDDDDKRMDCVDDLKNIFITSGVSIFDSEEDILAKSEFHILSSDTESGCVVGVKKAEGHKCQRCWLYCKSVNRKNSDGDIVDICSRCANVLNN